MLNALRSLALAAVALVLSGCGLIAADIPYEVLEQRYGGGASRYMELSDGLRIHYRDEGPAGEAANGAPLVMVHGFAASLHTWEPWTQRFSKDHRVIRLDLPGHGLTRAPEGYVRSQAGDVAVVEAVTRRLGAQRFVIIGNSMGGGVAWAYAMAHPDRVSGLVLVDSVGMPAPREGKGPPLIFKLLRNPLGRAILRRADPRPLAVPGLRQGYVDATLVTDDLVDRYVELARAPGHRALLLSGQAAPRTPMSPAAFAAIKAPTLIMHGEADTVIPVEAGRGLARAIPGAELVTWPGVGHVPMEQIPQRSGDVLSAFLGRLPAVAEGTGGAGEAP